MIVPMMKYSLLVFHREYQPFLLKLQELGVVHISSDAINETEEIKAKHAQILQYEATIQFLEKQEVLETSAKLSANAEEIIAEIQLKQKELAQLQQEEEELQKALLRAKPWGNFSHERFQQIKEAGVTFHFFTANKNLFLKFQEENLPVEILFEQGNQLTFLFVQTKKEEILPDAELVHPPTISHAELLQQLEANSQKQIALKATFLSYAAVATETLIAAKNNLTNQLLFDKAIADTNRMADDKLMLLQGWVPQNKAANLERFLENEDILFVPTKPTPNDDVPVLLTNNRFARLFEPIGSMFSLPDYKELDLTLFFAPFFMLFFGFCLGDAGYGLLFIVGGGIYKLRAPKNVVPYLHLIQLLGVATLLFGAISGTLFGINLIETPLSFTEKFRDLFLDPNQMFNLALALGGIQIIFGMIVKAANYTRQFGFSYALATIGWLIILLGSAAYYLLINSEMIPPNKIILYTILGLGGFFVLFFSDPGVNVFARVGKGVWDVYSTVTGIFGDLLSYIRLFALGLSSAILGFVINDIGLQILGASKILGPIFFVIFLLLGHTLNILISSLGSFVHPMRLTFVEFYKSAGFKGGGEAYQPFKKSESEIPQ